METLIFRELCTGGGIVWQKLYKWRVYKVNSVSIYKYKLASRQSNNSFADSLLEVYKDISINEDTGIINLTNRIVLREYGTYGYIRMYGCIYYGFYNANGPEYIDVMKEFYATQYIARVNKEKGNFLKEISAANKNEYPSNGIKGGYWYELVG